MWFTNRLYIFVFLKTDYDDLSSHQQFSSYLYYYPNYEKNILIPHIIHVHFIVLQRTGRSWQEVCHRLAEIRGAGTGLHHIQRRQSCRQTAKFAEGQVRGTRLLGIMVSGLPQGHTRNEGTSQAVLFGYGGVRQRFIRHKQGGLAEMCTQQRDVMDTPQRAETMETNRYIQRLPH